MDRTDTTHLIGQTLGEYTLLDEIGRGGMGTVYRARSESIKRIVAIKVLSPSLLVRPGLYQRFEREVDIIARLEHPHILPVYSYGKEGDMPYIVMRYLSGGSMHSMIGCTSLGALKKPFRQIAQALDYAHRHGIIHRDIKPTNIMLDKEGNAYLSDFGIARATAQLQSTMTGGLTGTPAYMSPEQAREERVTRVADIYSLGVTLFHILTGEHPFKGKNIPEVLVQHIKSPLPSLADYRSDLPLRLDGILARATAKDPKERYQSVIEFNQAFNDIAYGKTATLTMPSKPLDPAILEKYEQEKKKAFNPHMHISLKIGDFEESMRFSFQKGYTMVAGRRDESSIAVDIDLNPFGGFEQGVSRRHVAFEVNALNNNLEIRDLSSSNGTYINGMRLVAGQRYPLRDGDELQLGQLVIRTAFQYE